MAHEIDYRLIGDDMQAVIVTPDPRETVVAEAGVLGGLGGIPGGDR